MAFKKRIYVTRDNQSEEDMLAWTKLSSADDGKVGVYELVEEFDKRTTPEIKRKGTKTWFKTS